MTAVPASPALRPIPGGASRARRGAPVAAVLVLASLLPGCGSPSMADRPSMMAPPMLGAPTTSIGPAPDGVPSVDLRGYRIATRVGDVFEVRLPGFPSSGYRWTLVGPVPSVVRADRVASSEAGAGELAGVPAQETWRFSGAEPGSGTLRFEFRRPADPPTMPPAQRATYRIEVR
ncbi:MAG: protease inhibitor I42 family protein [Burkholderiaceae bacterium]|jgi:predicted secreted protein|nr:protease inhibitor I42 family protein [Burkholderiales bacterium]MCZ8339300.1 protease inhibitor I42 family protein [Burkholderiaceae bacterium]